MAFIKTPAESNAAFIKYAETIRETPGIDYGCVLDKKVIPLRPGDVLAIVARPGHGKSAFMAYMSRRAAYQIVKQGKEDQEVVLYFSWEQPVEQMEANFQAGSDYSVSDIGWGRADIETVISKSLNRVNLPIWVGGKSLSDANKRQSPMTIDAIYQEIRELKNDYGVVPKLICLDYLQIIPVPGKNDRHTEVTEATYQAKELAMDVGCPIIFGVQAKAAVDSTASKIPGLGDAYYSSAVEHVADKQFGLLKPIKVHEAGRKIQVSGHDYTVDDNLLLIKMSKQRMEQGAWTFVVNFDMSRMVMSDYNFLSLNDPEYDRLDLQPEW